MGEIRLFKMRWILFQMHLREMVQVGVQMGAETDTGCWKISFLLDAELIEKRCIFITGLLWI